jgi:gamma-glutamyltranspeptidase/glutathione hydrolase
MINVTHGEAASFVGIAPTMVYNAETGEVKSYIGVGKAPAAASIEAFKDRGWETVPEMNIWSQLVPASVDVMTNLLQECGTLSFSELAAPAIQTAREGFPIHDVIMQNFDMGLIERLGMSIILPYNAEVYLNGQWWRPLYLHDRFSQPDLANTLETLAQAETEALDAGASEDEGYQAVHDAFYQGSIAQTIAAFEEKEKGLITYEDLATYTGGWEQPVSGSYGEFTFYSNSGWSQGAMVPHILQILEGIDLENMGHNIPEYIHTVAQAIELAFADRDAYLADPAFFNIPLDVLLSKEFAAQRRAQMSDQAFLELPGAGAIDGYSAYTGAAAGDPFIDMNPLEVALAEAHPGQDTSQLVVLDSLGNSVVMTPSDFPLTPMVTGTGINLGNRMNQFRLDDNSVNSLQPGKRPRVTPHAVIVFKDGEYYMSYSTPGGDMQPQALVQVFLNMVIFDMDIQEAISAPRFYDISAPESFAPHDSYPGTIRLEADLYEVSAEGLADYGYTIERDEMWNKDFGAVGAILVNSDGTIHAGSDPREETTAGGK